MKIKRLYIKDFGIFREQLLEDIGPGLVVIGGPNRAGKTTFLQILKYLGYGFPRGKKLPPATRKYEVEGDILLNNNKKFNLFLQGHGEPKITCLTDEGNDIPSIEDIFPLDKFTYHRLYTINLDELRRIPEGIDDTERLQSILLGAGLGEIIQLPRLEKEFSKKAHGIGRTYGNPRYGSFAPYYERIQKGLELRDEALEQVEKYTEVREELHRTNRELKRLNEKRIPDLENQQIVLDVLKNNYNTYKELKELSLQLDKEKAEELLEEFPAKKLHNIEDLREKHQQAEKNYRQLVYQFKQEVIDHNIQDVKEKILEYKDHISNYYHRLSGLKERINNYQEQYRDFREVEEDIKREIQETNKDWDFKDLKELSIDRLKRGTVEENLTRYSELKDEINEKKKDKKELENRCHTLEEQLTVLESAESISTIKGYFILAILVTFTGVIVSFLDQVSGLIIGFGGVLSVFYYYRQKEKRAKNNLEIKKDIKLQLGEVKRKLRDREREIEELIAKLNPLQGKVKKYRNLLELNEDVSPERLRVYFGRVFELKKKIMAWESRKERLVANKEELMAEFKKALGILKEFNELIPEMDQITDTYNEDNKLLSFQWIRQLGDKINFSLEKMYNHLKIASKLEQAERILKDTEDEIYRLPGMERKKGNLSLQLDNLEENRDRYEELQEIKSEYKILKARLKNSLSSDRAKSAFFKIKGEPFTTDGTGQERQEELLFLFDKLYQDYISYDDVVKEYNLVQKSLGDIREKLDILKGKEQSLKDELERLATTEKLEKAQKQIDEARFEMRILAERYAVYRAAEFIINKVKQRFMEKAGNHLLKKASKIIKEITTGEYKRILPPENLTEADFQAVLQDGSKQNSTRVLSRGTREQLFLAIRVSRIRQLEPSLPVIIDDSLVNFDMSHLVNTIEVLRDLATSHQVFVLTCHPHLVQSLSRVCGDKDETQYWRLEKGKFNLSSDKELINFMASGID